jgi:hypothetical protein
MATLREVLKVAEKGPIVASQTIGGTLLLMGLLDRLAVVPGWVAAQEATPEVIALLTVGALLVLAGVAAETYNYRIAVENVFRSNQYTFELNKARDSQEYSLEAQRRGRQTSTPQFQQAPPPPGQRTSTSGERSDLSGPDSH